MSALDTDIKKLYGVGPARAAAYATMGVYTVRDLLLHYPRGYEDRENIKLIAESDGEKEQRLQELGDMQIATTTKEHLLICQTATWKVVKILERIIPR